MDLKWQLKTLFVEIFYPHPSIVKSVLNVPIRHLITIIFRVERLVLAHILLYLFVLKQILNIKQ